jgi:hypothetical protein
MADDAQDNPVGTRLPTLDDVLLICRHALDRTFLRKWFADHGQERHRVPVQ